MRELLRTNDPVLLSFVCALLEEAEIGFHVADEAFASVEGSLGILPRRLLVLDEDFATAAKRLAEAGVEPSQG